MAVLRADVARDGDGVLVADARPVGEGDGRAALRQGVAEVDPVLVATGEGVAEAGPRPDVEPLSTAPRPELHQVEIRAELGVVVVHPVVTVGFQRHSLGVERGEALLPAIARPEVFRTHADPRADGVVHAAAKGGRLHVTALGIEVLIPDASGPREPALCVDAPGAGAQLAVPVPRRHCPAIPVALRLRAGADGDGCGKYDAETRFCPSAAEGRDERSDSSFFHVAMQLVVDLYDVSVVLCCVLPDYAPSNRCQKVLDAFRLWTIRVLRHLSTAPPDGSGQWHPVLVV